MPNASIKKIIPCKKIDLINMILDIEKYPEFVPWCLDSKVYEKKDKGDTVEIIADLTIWKSFFKDLGDSSEVEFQVDFELKNKILNLLMNKSFDLGLIKIADAFQKRADELFNKT